MMFRLPARRTVALTCSVLGAAATLSVAASAQAATPTTLHDHATIAPLQMLEGDYQGEKTSAACVKLRTKIMAKRTALKTSSEWRAVSGSEAYKAFEDSHKNLKDAKCDAATASAEQAACTEMTTKVTQAADVLAETAPWKSLTASKSWRGLFQEFASAKKLGCISPAPKAIGTK